MRFGKVAVTGGSGHLGQFVVRELERHCAVTVIDRAPSPSSSPFVQIDILDLDALVKAVDGHDAVVHLAALDFAVDASPKAFFETNVQGTWNLFYAANLAGARKVAMASSSSVYDLNNADLRHSPVYLPIDEAHPLRASGAYGLSKVVGETIAEGFSRRGPMETVCLRPVLIMRPGLAAETVEALAMIERDEIDADDPGGVELPSLRSYVRPEDVARCFRLALEAEGVPFDVFNVAAADSFAPEPTLAWVERQFGALPEIRRPKLFAERPNAAAFDISHAHERLGWEPEGDWASLSLVAVESV